MSKPVQAYFIIAIATILIFASSYQATMYFGDAVSRMFF